jgi:hypothetical protein
MAATPNGSWSLFVRQESRKKYFRLSIERLHARGYALPDFNYCCKLCLLNRHATEKRLCSFGDKARKFQPFSSRKACREFLA